MEAWEKRGANRLNLWVEFRGAGHGRGPRQQNHPLSCLSEQEQPIREGGGNNYNWTIYKWPHTDMCITFILMHGTITILNHIKNCRAVLWGFDGKRDLTVCFFPQCFYLMSINDCKNNGQDMLSQTWTHQREFNNGRDLTKIWFIPGQCSVYYARSGSEKHFLRRLWLQFCQYGRTDFGFISSEGTCTTPCCPSFLQSLVSVH